MRGSTPEAPSSSRTLASTIPSSASDVVAEVEVLEGDVALVVTAAVDVGREKQRLQLLTGRD